MRFWTHLLTSGTSSAVCWGGSWRGWSRGAGAVPRAAEPGLSPPPPGCLSLGGDTKSSRSLLSGSVQLGERGRWGRWGASPKAGQGAGVADTGALGARSTPRRTSRGAGGRRGGTTGRCCRCRRRHRLCLCRARLSPRRERSVSFGLFLCSAPPESGAARGARWDVSARKAAAPGAGKQEAGRRLLVLGIPFGWWMGVVGPKGFRGGKRRAWDRGKPRAVGRWSLQLRLSGRWWSWAVGWG